MRTIVVGFEGDETSERALDRALEEARGGPAHVVVVAVAEMPLDPAGLQTFGTLDDSPAPAMPPGPPAAVEGMLAAARRKVEQAGASADYVWEAGEPGAAIVAVAKDRRADLVVLGSHHHGLFSRMLGTDVAAEVEREAGCDVVVVD